MVGKRAKTFRIYHRDELAKPLCIIPMNLIWMQTYKPCKRFICFWFEILELLSSQSHRANHRSVLKIVSGRALNSTDHSQQSAFEHLVQVAKESNELKTSFARLKANVFSQVLIESSYAHISTHRDARWACNVKEPSNTLAYVLHTDELGYIAAPHAHRRTQILYFFLSPLDYIAVCTAKAARKLWKFSNPESWKCEKRAMGSEFKMNRW